MKRRIYCRSILLTVFSVSFLSALADKTDYKSYSEDIKNTVYAKALPAFEVREIPEKYANEPAVVVAEYNELDVKKNDVSGMLRKTSDLRINANELNRMLIWINSKDALEHYSEFDFASEISRRSSGSKHSARQALGVKVIKPDGREIDVNADEFIDVSEGKKGKDKRKKLAVPDLEIGDFIDIFIYKTYEVDNSHLLGLEYEQRQPHPILDYNMHATLDGSLSSHYRTINGAAPFTGFRDKAGNFTLDVHLTDVPATPRVFYSSTRQTPRIEFNIYNRDIDGYTPPSARGVGLIADPEPGVIKDDMWIALSKMYYKGCGIDYLKNDIKNAAEIIKKLKAAYNDCTMTSVEVADCIYNLMVFAGAGSSDAVNEVWFDLCLEDLLCSIISDEVVSVITTRSHNEPIDRLASFYNATTGHLLIGKDRYYFAPGAIMEPSELHSSLVGRKAQQFFLPEYRVENPGTDSIYFFLPEPKPARNRKAVELKGNIDGSSIDVKRKVIATGAAKTNAQDFLSDEAIIEAYQNYFKSYGLDVALKEKGKKLADKLAHRESETEDLLDAFKDEVKGHHGSVETEFSDGKLLTVGVDPRDPRLIYEVDYKIHDIVKRAGRNQIVSIGKLIDRQDEFAEADRTRSDEAMIGAPREYVTRIELTIPEGMSVGERSLEGLQTTVANSVGVFSAQTSLDEGKLIINVAQRFNKRMVSPEAWSELLELIDAAVKWKSATLLLESKS